MIVVLGDLHFRPEEPFYSASKEFCEWFIDQPFHDPENILIQLGDIFHEARSNGKVNLLMMDMFFNKLKFKHMYVIQGNHDVSKKEGSGLQPLKVVKNTTVIELPTIIDIEDKKILFLPYYYPFSNDLRPMKEEYQDIDFGDSEYDFIMTHVSDETQTLDKNYVDLSYLKGKRISGHIHIPSKNYLGTPYPTRYDERGKDNRIYLINLPEYKKEGRSMDTLIPVPPVFLEYADLKFGDDLPFPFVASHVIWDIYDAPSRDAVRQKYGNIHIRKIHKPEGDTKTKKRAIQREEQQTVEVYFSDFCTTNSIEPELQDMLADKIRRRT